jgi:hypothetical protein
MYGKLPLPNPFFLYIKFAQLTNRFYKTDNLSSLDALITALANLDNVCETIEDGYLNSLIHDSFERWEEKS